MNKENSMLEASSDAERQIFVFSFRESVERALVLEEGDGNRIQKQE